MALLISCRAQSTMIWPFYTNYKKANTDGQAELKLVKYSVKVAGDGVVATR